MKNKKEKIIKAFVTLLKQNNAINEYRTNVLKSNSFTKSIQPFFRIQINSLGDSGLFNGAFVWSKTKQGDAYWRNLNAKWQEILQNI